MRKDLNKLNITMLSALEALYLCRKTTLAAERLGMAQPSLSQYLKQLRDITGDPLFVRTTHGMEPTGFCDAYYLRVKEALDALEALAGVKNAAYDPKRAPASFSMAVPFIKGRMLFEEMSIRLSREFPLVTSNLVNRPEKQALEDVERGIADIYVGLVSAKLEKHFSITKALKTELVVICSDQSPFFAKGRIGKKEYLKTPHIKATGSFDASFLDAEFRSAGLLQENLVSVPDIWAEIALLKETSHLLVIDRSDIGFINEGRNFRVLKTDFDIPQFTFYAVWHARRNGDPAHKWYRERLLDVCRKSPRKTAA